MKKLKKSRLVKYKRVKPTELIETTSNHLRIPGNLSFSLNIERSHHKFCIRKFVLKFIIKHKTPTVKLKCISRMF